LQWIGFVATDLTLEAEEQTLDAADQIGDARLLVGAAVNFEPPAANFLDEPAAGALYQTCFGFTCHVAFG